MTFEEFLEDASPSEWGVRSELEKKQLLKVVTSIANRYGRFEYNQALEDVKTRIELLETVGCDICGGGFSQCGCVLEGRNAGLKEAISELEKLKK